MNIGHIRSWGVVNVLSDQFLQLVRNLIKGNMKKGLRLAEESRQEGLQSGMKITIQMLIEKTAQAQAVKNSLINSPSIVPGLGTLLSFGLMGVENFFLLDESIVLIIALCDLHGIDVHDMKAMEKLSVQVIGEVFGVGDMDKKKDFHEISREYVTRTLPMQYLNSGISRWLKKILRRLLPFKSGSRLLPAGIGLCASAINAYDTIINVGQSTLRHIPAILNKEAEK